jgi:large subunit ribosomal protein L31
LHWQPPRCKRQSFAAGRDRRPFCFGVFAVKPNIHPEYHEINIIMTDGTEFKTMSCMGKAGDTLRLDIDPKSHPAWTGVQRMVDSGGQVAKFNKKFASIGKRKE